MNARTNKSTSNSHPVHHHRRRRRHIHIALAASVFLASFSPWQQMLAPKDGSSVREPAQEVNLQTYRRLSCAGLATSAKPFEAAFTTYFKPVYGNANGYDAPRRVQSSNPEDLANPGESVNGPAPGTNASWNFFCAVGMECSCPLGYESNLRCYADSGAYAPTGINHGWAPCKPFDQKTAYCDETNPQKYIPNQTVAADNNCFDLNAGCQIEVDGTYTLTITDTGGAIQGRRFDLYTKAGEEPLFPTGLHSVRVKNPGTCHPPT
ncbi:MAG TPA: 3D domain-containing protein [Patescibacteria group bacterium]|nr:3D domain-containing protein [Patescibacteria group bacterium]